MYTGHDGPPWHRWPPAVPAGCARSPAAPAPPSPAAPAPCTVDERRGLGLRKGCAHANGLPPALIAVACFALQVLNQQRANQSCCAFVSRHDMQHRARTHFITPHRRSISVPSVSAGNVPHRLLNTRGCCSPQVGGLVAAALLLGLAPRRLLLRRVPCRLRQLDVALLCLFCLQGEGFVRFRARSCAGVDCRKYST